MKKTNLRTNTNILSLRIGITLLVLACLLWLSLLVIPLLSLSIAQKAVVSVALLVAGEITFWLGVLLTGKQFAQKYLGKLWHKK
jgi:hypothetical protein